MDYRVSVLSPVGHAGGNITTKRYIKATFLIPPIFCGGFQFSGSCDFTWFKQKYSQQDSENQSKKVAWDVSLKQVKHHAAQP
jgi:hypothetical protein